MFAGFAYTERIPVRIATVLYEVGNTWMIAFLYLLLVFARQGSSAPSALWRSS